ncbi:hypothetical protein RHMOL_Rhmol02G0205100 [Rhododendron molle]|uniref:Uncharacterized protein n=1 Tax=Rhododendron molle TaxID=49168 RepID=A0ACC0PU22_RHOML|nr:hypothetical protein RHMOL_Rhmol02G0205100 [Rhododendron molle]
MASSPPHPPINDTTLPLPPSDIPSSSIATSRDAGKAPAVEATILGGVLSTCVLRSSRRTLVVGGTSLKPDPPETEFDAPSDAGNEALPLFNADTYMPPVHIIGCRGSLRYRPSLSDVPPEASHRESE